jgi:hypothetical protein
MARKATAAEVILEALAVAQGMGCSFEELIGLCRDLTWNQIFLEVDRLSREGRVQLSQDKPGVYRVRLAKPASATQAGSGQSMVMRSGPAEEARGNPGGCRRCGGLLVPEPLPELLLDSGPVEVWGRRCVQCGNIVDPAVQRRYAAQAHTARRSASEPLKK